MGAPVGGATRQSTCRRPVAKLGLSRSEGREAQPRFEKQSYKDNLCSCETGLLYIPHSPRESPLPPPNSPRYINTMSLKRVHFANADVYYTAPPSPATPSPSKSDVSLPDSDGPWTPPSFGVPVSLPPTAHVRLHSALAYAPSYRPVLDWDITTPPSTATHNPLTSPVQGGMRTILSAPATNPPLPYLELVLDCLPYKISVRPGTVVSVPSPYMAPGAPLMRADNGYVTVGDVLNSIYTTLRLAVSRAELAVVPANKAAKLAAAYERRVSRIRDARERHLEAEKGVKRVDWVIAEGNTRFFGLRGTRKGVETWGLMLG